MFDEAISIISLWASMHTLLTPTLLFLLLNLMIATIALTSYKPHNHHQEAAVHLHQHLHHPPQITRAPSLIQSLKSINFYSYYSQSHSHTHVHQVLAHQQQKLSSTHNPPSKHAPELTPLPHIGEAQARVQVHETLSQEDNPKINDDIDGPTMDEIYSKIKGTTPAHHYGRQKYDINPVGGEIPVKLPAKMNKSASHKSPFSHFLPLEEPENVAPVKLGKEKETIQPVPKTVAAAAAVGGDKEVDSKADDFINKFRQQLKLQRIESIVRYKDI